MIARNQSLRFGVSGRMNTPLRRLMALTLLVMGVAACAPGATASPAPTGVVTLTLLAGPVCPVEQDPPDPNCAARPVADHEVVLLAGDREVARGRSDARGMIRFEVPYGRYVVHPVGGQTFPTAPGDQAVDVGAEPATLTLDYDTGIR